MRRILALAGALCFLANVAFAQSVGQTGSPTVSLGANQSVNLTQVNGSTISLGQAVMASSLPVVIASNQTGFPVFAAPTSTTANGLSNVVSSAVETGHVIKASAGNLYAFEVTSGATAGEVLIHNSTTVPAAGAVTPLKCYQLPANTTVGGGWEPVPLAFSTGIAISFSTATTCFTQTNSATAFISGDFL